MDFKSILKNRRAELGLTLDEVARYVGVSGATVSRWEHGDIENIRRDKIAKLAEVLQVTPTYLMGWPEINAEQRKAPTHQGERQELSPAFFRLKQGLEPYDISDSDVDFLLDVYKAYIKKKSQE